MSEGGGRDPGMVAQGAGGAAPSEMPCTGSGTCFVHSAEVGLIARGESCPSSGSPPPVPEQKLRGKSPDR